MKRIKKTKSGKQNEREQKLFIAFVLTIAVIFSLLGDISPTELMQNAFAIPSIGNVTQSGSDTTENVVMIGSALNIPDSFTQFPIFANFTSPELQFSLGNDAIIGNLMNVTTGTKILKFIIGQTSIQSNNLTTSATMVGRVWSNATLDSSTKNDLVIEASTEIINLADYTNPAVPFLEQGFQSNFFVFNFTTTPSLSEGQYLFGFEYTDLHDNIEYIDFKNTETENSGFNATIAVCAGDNINFTDVVSRCPDNENSEPAIDPPADFEFEIVSEETVPNLSVVTTIAPTKLRGYWTFDDNAIDGHIALNAGTLGHEGDASMIDFTNNTNADIMTTTGLFGEAYQSLPRKFNYNTTVTNFGSFGDSATGYKFSNDQPTSFSTPPAGVAGSDLATQFDDNSTISEEIRYGTDGTSIWNFIHAGLEGDNQTSINFWVKGDVDELNEVPLLDTGGTNNGFSLYTIGGEMQLTLREESTTIFDQTFPTVGIPPDDTDIHMITLMMDKGNTTNFAKLCIDGSSNCESRDIDNSFTGTVSDADFTLTSGSNHFFTSITENPFAIDDVTVWQDYTLTDADIDAMYDGGAGSSAGVTGESISLANQVLHVTFD